MQCSFFFVVGSISSVSSFRGGLERGVVQRNFGAGSTTRFNILGLVASSLLLFLLSFLPCSLSLRIHPSSVSSSFLKEGESWDQRRLLELLRRITPLARGVLPIASSRGRDDSFPQQHTTGTER